jgi:hypothetical protein
MYFVLICVYGDLANSSSSLVLFSMLGFVENLQHDPLGGRSCLGPDLGRLTVQFPGLFGGSGVV